MSDPSPTPVPIPVVPGKSGSSIKTQEALLCLLLVVLVIGSSALVGWSLQRLRPAEKHYTDLSLRMARLSAEVDQMDRQWARPEVEQTLTNFSEIESRFSGGQPALEGWLRILKEQTIPLAFDFKTDFGQTTTKVAGSQKLTVIPATVSVDVLPASGLNGIRSPYQRVMDLSQRLAAGLKRADLVQLSVVGGTNSVSHAVMVFNLWGGEERPE